MQVTLMLKIRIWVKFEEISAKLGVFFEKNKKNFQFPSLKKALNSHFTILKYVKNALNGKIKCGHWLFTVFSCLVVIKMSKIS